MSKKTDKQLAIDVMRGVSGAPGEALTSTPSSLAPALPVPPAPTDVTIGTMTIGRSSASAVAIVPVTWRPPGGTAVASYLIEVATDSGFTTIVQRGVASGPSASLELKVSTTFYVRVYARYGAQTSSPSAAVTFTTPADLTPAGQPTSAAAAFIGAGDLQITWTNPTDENLRDVEVRIWASSAKTTLLHTAYEASGRYVWTAAQNRDAGSGTPDPSVYVELKSRTWSLVLGTAVVVGTITKAVPSTPGSLASDFTAADCVITWAAVANAAFYRLSIDGVARDLVGTRYAYPFDLNRQEHSGTPDPVLTLSLIAVDALDQVSTAATATATNAAPSAPSAVAVAGGFTTIGATVTSTAPADFLAYRYRLIQTSPSASDVTWDDASPIVTRTVTTNATYQLGVKIVDVFGQASTETLSSTAAIDAITIDDLRSDASYRDSDGNTFTAPASGTLAALKDGVTASGGVTYAA